MNIPIPIRLYRLFLLFVSFYVHSISNSLSLWYHYSRYFTHNAWPFSLRQKLFVDKHVESYTILWHFPFISVCDGCAPTTLKIAFSQSRKNNTRRERDQAASFILNTLAQLISMSKKSVEKQRGSLTTTAHEKIEQSLEISLHSQTTIKKTSLQLFPNEPMPA